MCNIFLLKNIKNKYYLNFFIDGVNQSEQFYTF